MGKLYVNVLGHMNTMVKFQIKKMCERSSLTLTLQRNIACLFAGCVV